MMAHPAQVRHLRQPEAGGMGDSARAYDGV